MADQRHIMDDKGYLDVMCVVYTGHSRKKRGTQNVDTPSGESPNPLAQRAGMANRESFSIAAPP